MKPDVPGSDPINPSYIFRPMTADEIKQAQEREKAEGQREYECSEEYFVAKMKALIGMRDCEVSHGEADDILCAFLELRGYSDLVDAWREVPKWYA